MSNRTLFFPYRLFFTAIVIIFIYPADVDAGFVSVKPEEKDPKAIAKLLVAPKGQYSSVVALTLSRPGAEGTWKSYFCSGVLIAPRWVLTVAHCVKDASPERFKIKIGAGDLSKSRAVDISKIIIHPDYGETSFKKNIALIQLKHDADAPLLNLTRQPAFAIIKDTPGTGSAIVAGWGELVEWTAGEPINNQNLMSHLSVKVIPNEICNRPQAYEGKVAADQFCAASIFELVDACRGFSGAPLISFDAKGRQFAVGLVSWGEGCARKEKPTVYQDIGTYIDWIEQHTGSLESLPATNLLRAINLTSKAEPQIEERLVDPNPNLAPEGLFRYMVSIGRKGKNQALGHFCGGVLVTPNHVITAAHCVKNYEQVPDSLQLKIDSDILSRGGVLLKAKRIIPHEGYEPAHNGPPKNDVALIEIEGDVPSDILPPPVAHPASEITSIIQKAQDATVIGWGKNAFSKFGRTSNYLHWTTVKLIDPETCTKNHNGLVDDHMLCAGNDYADSCQGDSGGPLLMVDNKQEFFLVGLVSWGEGCAKADKPGVYVRISEYFGWINANLIAQGR